MALSHPLASRDASFYIHIIIERLIRRVRKTKIEKDVNGFYARLNITCIHKQHLFFNTAAAFNLFIYLFIYLFLFF